MRPFEYTSPTTAQQVPALLSKSWGEVEILAGGSDLLSLMKDEITTPRRLVNIKQVAGLHAISNEGGALQFGTLVTLDRIGAASEVQHQHPMLASAAGDAASPQIRNVATIGGNLCQRPRCWYFRTGYGLLAQKDGKSLVTQGDNRYHAILGNDGPAYFVSPSTIAPVLIAYNAKLQIMGPRGSRDLPLEKFFVIPKTDQQREHDLQPDEFITHVIVPPAPGVRAAHYEAAEALQGKAVTPATADEAAKAAVSNAKSLGHNTQKIHLARVAVKRAILAAAGAPARASVERNGHGGVA